tara:strand:- start:7768 stop:7989 length:222 start_codon:yes stop_codon:yes gene_type:complete
MTRENLKSFITAAERKISIRSELKNINQLNELIKIASKYGFKITEKDIQEANSLDHIQDWFNKSRIYPLRKFS